MLSTPNENRLTFFILVKIFYGMHEASDGVCLPPSELWTRQRLLVVFGGVWILGVDQFATPITQDAGVIQELILVVAESAGRATEEVVAALCLIAVCVVGTLSCVSPGFKMQFASEVRDRVSVP